MKLRRCMTPSGPQVEALKPGTADDWICLSALDGLADMRVRFAVSDTLSTNILSVLELGYDGWQMLSDKLDVYDGKINDSFEDKTLLVPVEPASFRDFLLFEQHFINASRGFLKRFAPKKHKLIKLYEYLFNKPHPKLKPPAIWYEHPLYYFGNHLNFITSGEAIRQPAYTKVLDYELELGAILAKPLLNATPDEATNAIGGYVVLNDLSARDIQFAEMKSGFGPQKAKHFQNAMSPIIVTADEINHQINQLDASVVFNGIHQVPCSTRNMQYTLGEAIAYASKDEPLYPGELFGSGTLPGGCGMENNFWLESGSLLELTIGAIGVLTNKVC